MAATITRISQSAGCSPATVSRVLNNSGPVSPVTREAVLRHARELGYIKPSAPKGRSQSEVSSRIAGRAVEVVMHWRDPIERIKVGSEGVSVDSLEPFQDRRYFTSGYHLTNSFHREIIDGIVGELQRWGVKAVVEVASDLSSEQFLKDLNAPDKLGVLLLGELTDLVAPFCDNCSHPLVLVDIMHRGWRDVVTIDNFGGSRSAVEHLFELGHRDIGFTGWAGNPAFQDRKAGYIATLFELGLSCKPEWCCEETVHIEEKAEELADLLSSRNRPTALFCSNDFQALSAIKAASKVGLSVPKDLSIVGFDDIELAHFTTPALTTIHVPVAELGRLAARQLVISSEGVGSEKLMGALGSDTRVRTQLVRRESTARLE